MRHQIVIINLQRILSVLNNYDLKSFNFEKYSIQLNFKENKKH